MDDRSPTTPPEPVATPAAGGLPPLPDGAAEAALGRRLPRPLREFLATEAAGGVVLLVATVVALVWANSPWSDAYHHLIETPVAVRVGDHEVGLSFEQLVNDLLMALFFFVVGLEIVRELTTGELRTWRAASLPVVCAVGGMVVPAAIYLAVNAGAAGSHGWGIPMATDIAFAVGVLALLGSRVPAGLKVFLLALAVVDDLGAIVVIAVAYTPSVDARAAAAAVALLGVVALLRVLQVRWWPAYVLPAVGVWLALYASGLHATLAGVALALLVPARPRTPVAVVRDLQADLADDLDPDDVRTLTRLTSSTISTGDRFAHALHPLVSFVIVPLFALVNAGIALGGQPFGTPDALRVGVGTGLGLVVGKPVGIVLAALVAVRLGVARLPAGTTWRQLAGVGAVAGIGFTVSLFVTNLAFPSAELTLAAKTAILAASAVAAGVGAIVVARAGRSRPTGGRAQPSGPAGTVAP